MNPFEMLLALWDRPHGGWGVLMVLVATVLVAEAIGRLGLALVATIRGPK
jgi:hypothetical protein